MPPSEYLRTIVEENSRLNEAEFGKRSISLASFPRTIFMQIDAPCNQDCLFCSRSSAYRYFDLDEYRRTYEDILAEAMQHAERLILTGSGEHLSLPRAKENLDYFHQFQYAEKMFATNGSTMTPKMIDRIAASGNRYTIHVSLHASKKDIHRAMAQADTWDAAQENIEYLQKVKRQVNTLTVNFVFLLTTRNIDDFPDFIRFAAGRGADGVVAYYNYVYRLDQKPLSCYFIQDKANAALDTAEKIVREEQLPLRLMLPPRFKQKEYHTVDLCGEAWSQIMINAEGDVITCDIAGDSRESLKGKSFDAVWNGPYYTAIRRRLASGDRGCAGNCFRANPALVNDFRSHIITRGKSEEEIRKYLEPL